MPAPISAFGAFHTAVSVLGIVFGLLAFARYGKIDSKNWIGKLYLGAMFIGSITAFGIFRHGTFTVGHALSLATLSLLFSGLLATRVNWFGHWKEYVETASFSASFFLLWVFTVTETLTRLPVGNPLAAGPDAPLLLGVQLGLVVTFLLGVGYQFVKLRTAAREANRAIA